MVNGRREAVVFDDATDQAGRWTETDGVSHLRHDLQHGKCSVSIESTIEAHFGTWSCFLITQNGEVYNGQVVVKGKWYCKVKFIWLPKYVI